jgi:replicative DNA helicase
MLDHWRKYTEAPNLAVLNRSFPSYGWEKPEHNLDYLMDALRERRHNIILVTALEAAATLLVKQDDPDVTRKIHNVLGEALLQATSEITPAVDLANEEFTAELRNLLDQLQDNPGFVRGIPTGFTGIDYATGGWQQEQFIVLMGLPKSLKSSVLLYMFLHALKQGKRALFMGFEMSNMEQGVRGVSLLSGVSLTKITNGTLSAKERRKVDIAVNRWEDGIRFAFSEDITNGTTVSGVRAKILDFQPEIVFIDAAYLMQTEIPGVDPTSPAAMTDVARKLKQLAQSVRIPVVVSVQASQTRASGGKLNAGSAMYTQAWRQSADVLLGSERVLRDDDDEAGDVQIKIRVLASRSGPYAESDILWDWNHGYVDEQAAVGATPLRDDAA